MKLQPEKNITFIICSKITPKKFRFNLDAVHMKFR